MGALRKGETRPPSKKKNSLEVYVIQAGLVNPGAGGVARPSRGRHGAGLSRGEEASALTRHP